MTLEHMVQTVLAFFEGKIGHWRAGSQCELGQYQLNRGPSIKKLLMMQMLTLPVFHRRLTNTKSPICMRQGYEIRQRITADVYLGFCGLHDGNDALALLLSEISNDNVICRLQPAIIEALKVTSFYQQLVRQGYLTVSHMMVERFSARYAKEKNIITAYLTEVLKNKVFAESSLHPGVLYALAYIKNISLYIWQVKAHEQLEPYKHDLTIAVTNSLRLDILWESYTKNSIITFSGYPELYPQAADRVYPGYIAENHQKRMRLVSRTDLGGGIQYDLDLTKDNFGGCNIKGLLYFLRNEFKRFAGYQLSPLECGDSAIDAVASRRQHRSSDLLQKTYYAPHSGHNLSKVNVLTQCPAVSQDKQARLVEELKTAIRQSLSCYLQAQADRETLTPPFSELSVILSCCHTLDEIVTYLTQFFMRDPEKWNPGKRLLSVRSTHGKSSEDKVLEVTYEKGSNPSLRAILMEHCLTLPLFKRRVSGHILHLESTTEEADVVVLYDLDLRQARFGGTHIEGLVEFFKNECRLHGGYGQIPLSSESNTIPAHSAR